MNLESVYKEAGAYLEGHFLLSSGNHSQFYLQSAKVLENPALAGKLANELFSVIKNDSTNTKKPRRTRQQKLRGSKA